jgi:hypothetical protein
MLFAITFVLSHRLSVVPAAKKQLQRTVIRNRSAGASASFRCALAPGWTAQGAGAEPGRWRHTNPVCFEHVMGRVVLACHPQNVVAVLSVHFAGANALR